MYRHLFEKKKLCPAVNPLELSNDIKDCVMRDRIYHIPKTKNKKRVNNNQYTINNMFFNMSIPNRIEHLMDHFKLAEPIKDFSETCYDYLDPLATPFREKDVVDDRCVFLNESEYSKCLEVVSSLTNKITKEDMGAMNLAYEMNKPIILIYEDGEWKENMLHRGVEYILQSVQQAYWSKYECCLIATIERNSNMRHRSECDSQLRSFYRFLTKIGLLPYVSGKDDQDIMLDYCNDNEYSETSNDLCIKYQKVFDQEKKEVTKRETNRTIKEIMDIIKSNGKSNLEKINELFLRVFNIDYNFQHAMKDRYAPIPINN